MKKIFGKLFKQYLAAMESYLSGRNEPALEQAYEVGRQAIEHKLSLLDVLSIHEKVMSSIIDRVSFKDEEARQIKASENIFAETLAPFDMTQRGFEEANSTLRDLNDTLERRVEERTEAIERLYMETMRALAAIIEAKDQSFSFAHLERLPELAAQLTKRLGLPDQYVKAVKVATYLHDIGKIAVPEIILAKKGQLSPGECQVINQYPVAGWEILRQVNWPWPVPELVRHHHERFDGTGSPDGLAGEAIPIGARILATISAWDAMLNDRPFRHRLSKKEALAELRQGRGTQFDPRVVDQLIELIEDIDRRGLKVA